MNGGLAVFSGVSDEVEPESNSHVSAVDVVVGDGSSFSLHNEL
jgi:hypothetical protein